MVEETTRSISKLIYTRRVKDLIFIVGGVLAACVGLKGFLLPNNFLDGGAMGVALLIEILTHINLSYLIIVVNLPFIIIGAKQISYQFAIKSTIAIISLSILVHYVSFPIITDDKLLIAVFGGFFLGAGIGLSIRGGAVIDGTEVMAIKISRTRSLTVGDFIAIFNVILFAIAILLTDIETGLYSMLTYLSASKTIDFIINGVDEYIGVLIMSKQSEKIKAQIFANLGRGVTVFKGDKGYQSEEENNVLFCVITRLEVSKLLLEIDKIDSKAFVVQHTIKDTKGGMIKKRPLH
jgi:uncharacterized membrane-anchored protein YitT (DUF2179 family)